MGASNGCGRAMDAEWTANRIKGAIYVLKVKNHGKLLQCGCPGAHPGTWRCDVEKDFYPKELEGIMTREAFIKMTTDLDQAFYDTHLPLCPCALTLICWGCAVQVCQIERTKKYIKILSDANSREMCERGYYWESMARVDPSSGFMDEYLAQLKIDKRTQDKWNAEHGIVTAPGVVVTPSQVVSGTVVNDNGGVQMNRA